MEAAVVLVRNRRVLILERAPGGLWERFWEFPTVHLEGANPAGRTSGRTDELEELTERVTGITARIGPPQKTIGYTVTRHRVKLIVHLARARSGDSRPGPGLVDARWVEPERLSDYTFSSAGRRLIAWIGSSSEFHALECLDPDS
jgi:A/G-specific adenine glycosylase